MKIVSLFSGAGGMDLGFIQAEHRVVWANDDDPDCVLTYQHNIGKHIVLADVRHIDLESIPDCDLVVGGFPCQGFSRANMKKSSDDDRNTLYLEFVKVLQQKCPKYFVAENVRGLLSLDNGRVMQMIKEDFENIGYDVKYEVFNTADYGVPQTRIRVIIIGVRKDVAITARPEFPRPTHSSKENLGLQKWVTISQALHGIPEPESAHNLINHVYSQYKVTNRDFTGHRLTNPDKPSPTILARGNGKGGVVAIQHPNNHRRMTVRESAIIQTFPLDFEFFGRLGSMYRQVGNAVPVLFAKKIAEEFSKIEMAGKNI
jgi:DNA (cytosine-5)-methyltransferase 1